MKNSAPIVIYLFALYGLLLSAAGTPSTTALPRSSPERQGVSSQGLLAFVEAAESIDAFHSFQLIRHGEVVAEGWWGPYGPGFNHELYSLSKSFTSTAVGLAISEGRLSIDDPVLKFFPEDAPPEPSENLRAMRVRDLLSMSTGHQDEPPTAVDKISAKSFLATPVPHKPGTHFKYNTAATFMLSAIVQKASGTTVRDFLEPRLFAPLGITQPVWNSNFQGISLGGYGLRVRTEDIARFGLLYLNHGRWQGRQLLPQSWVEAATSRQVSNGSNPDSDWDQGYGYQFWRCRNGAFRGDGAFGQYCVVMPDQDAVLAITSGVKDMQAVMNIIWDKLLPAMHPHRLAADPINQQRLKTRLVNLTLRQPSGAATSSSLGRVAGRKYIFPANDQKLESIRLLPGGDGSGWNLISRTDGVESQTPCGFRSWTRSRGLFGDYRDEPLAAAGAWVAEDTLEVKICAYETPFYRTLKLRFEGDQLIWESRQNVGFGPAKSLELTGHYP